MSEEATTCQDVKDFVRDWAVAIVSNDAGHIGEFMAPEWVMVSSQGIGSKDQFLSLVESGQLRHSAMDIVSEPRVRLHGDIALLSYRVTNTAHFAGQRYEADEWTSDVLMWRADGWQCALTQISPVEQLYAKRI